MNTQKRISYKELVGKVPIDAIKEIIKRFKADGITTVYTSDVIREYAGHFISNKHTPAGSSFNANFGKYLQAYSNYLGIREVASCVSIRDDEGHPTQSSMWGVL